MIEPGTEGPRVVENQRREWTEITLVTSVPLGDATVAPPSDTVEEPEEYGCQYVTFRGSKNYMAGNFGPDEYCEEPVEPGSDYCRAHNGNDDGRDHEPDLDYWHELRTDPYGTW
jgi:hypothetical protein